MYDSMIFSIVERPPADSTSAGVSFRFFLPAFTTTIERCLALPCRPHRSPGMHGTFFVSLWKREKCANRFLTFRDSVVVAKKESCREEREREREREREFSYSSRVRPHLHDSYSLHAISLSVITFHSCRCACIGEPCTPDCIQANCAPRRPTNRT